MKLKNLIHLVLVATLINLTIGPTFAAGHQQNQMRSHLQNSAGGRFVKAFVKKVGISNRVSDIKKTHRLIKDLHTKIDIKKKQFSYVLNGVKHIVKPDYNNMSLDVDGVVYSMDSLTNEKLGEILTGENHNNSVKLSLTSKIKKSLSSLGNILAPNAYAYSDTAFLISTAANYIAVACFLLSFTVVLAPVTLPVAAISLIVCLIAAKISID